MENMIAYCGLDCLVCPAYIATKNDDDEARIKTAELWSKEFQTQINPADINCDGCTVDQGRLFAHCQVCEIRKCAREKALENCGGCADFACSKLDFIYGAVPEAKATLERIRKS